MKLAFQLIVLLFFSSGATALVYEVVWSKYLGLIFGSTVQAQATVLAIFMGGLALGNRLFGRFADAARNPIRIYGVIELAIGLYALAFHALYLGADSVFAKSGAGLLEQPFLLLLLKGAISLALLLGPTVLMGGTLPLLAAWLARQSADAGRNTALFYAINSLGAVTGAGLAGFFLVNQFGLTGTLLGTGIVNGVIGLAALFISSKENKIAPSAPTAAEGASGEPAADMTALLKKSCLLVFATGAISMCMEVLAARALSLIFGASLQAFSTMLMAFILGIGAGSLVMSMPRMRRFIREETVVILLLGAAAMIGLFLFSIEQWTIAYVTWRNKLGATGSGYAWHLALTALISIVLLGIPAACLGVVVPLCIRLIGTTSLTLANHVGRLLTWNTLGAVTGVLAAGFVMMPLLGLHASLAALGILLCVAALARSLQGTRAMQAVSGGVLALLLIAAFASNEPWRRVMTSGAFRWKDPSIEPAEKMRHEFAATQRRFYKDGADATVVVKESPTARGTTQLILTINGKPDASSQDDLSTQYLLAHLPMTARPESRDVFVLGFGSGITAGALLAHPVDQVVVAENCRPVLEASKLFEPQNRSVLSNPRTKLFYEDARTVLKLSPRQYDIIISEPSNPWTAGIGSVFTREFYELAASRLKPGGVMAQWFHMYETEDEVVAMVLRTFNSVFPHMEIWESVIGDIILVGSQQPWTSTPERFGELYARPLVRADLEAIGLRTPEALWARQLASQATAFAIAGPGPVQTDAHPLLEHAAIRAFYRTQGAFGLFVFDERTMQAALAPERKRAALAALPDELLGPVFGLFPSGNPNLMHYYGWRMNETFGKNGHEVYSFAPLLKLIFRPDDAFPKGKPTAPGLSPVFEKMVQAEAAIQITPEGWRDAVQSIRETLAHFDITTLRPETFPMPPSHSAAVGAKACLQHGDRAAALEIIHLGLKLVPGDVQLAYLERVAK